MRLRVAALALAISGAALALPPVGQPRVLRADRSDVSAPLWLLRPLEPIASLEEHEPGRVPLASIPGAVLDPVVQSSPRALSTVPAGPGFEGIGQGFLGAPPAEAFSTRGVAPPDAQGDVGPNHYVQMVNSSFAVFSKTGAVQYGPVPTRTVFSGFGGPCEGSDGYDGIVLFDPLADRWLLSFRVVVNGTVGPFLQCTAVSSAPDPTGSYARYAFRFGMSNDYGKFGVWSDAYYSTYNMFDSANDGATMQTRTVCAMDRTRMLAGQGDAAMQCIDIDLGEVSGATPADLDGSLPPPPGAPGLVVGFWRSESLILYRFHVDWSDPRNSSLEALSVPVAPFNRPCLAVRSGACIPQLGSGSSSLDALSDRMMFRVSYRNLGSYESLVANHTVTGQGGSASGVRWYEIRDPGGDPLVYQQGTYAPDTNWRWLGSAATDRAGNIGLGFSISGPQMHPSLGIAGHLLTDAPGVMGQGEFIFPGGLGSQSSLSSRWGDYSSLSVDPVDDCTFWYTNQYVPFDGAYNWRSRLMTFALPGCATANDFAAWMAPARQTVRRGGTATMSLSTAALHHTALGKTVQLAVSQPRAGVSAAQPAPSALLPGQAATVTIAADANADLGEAPFTVQASAPTGTVSAEATAVVIDTDFTVAVDKPSVAVGAGGTTEILITTAPLFGAPEVVLFSAPHVPRGISVVFDPPFVRVGDSAKLRLRGDKIDLAGAGTVRVVASGNLVSHSATIHLRSLVLPTVRIILPLTHTSVRGSIPVSASAVPSPGTTVAAMDLLIDGSAIQAFPPPADSAPAELVWRTSTVDDGPHYLSVRATDIDGNEGVSDLVVIWVQNKNECGCSSDGGGWEALALGALLASIRRRRKR